MAIRIGVCCLLAGTVVACDGAVPPPRNGRAPAGIPAPSAAPTSMESLVGLWDDGLIGENTKLDLRADGSAHIVSKAVVPATWTFEVQSLRVTITSRRQADSSTVLQQVTYDPGRDVLAGPFFGPGGPAHDFRRASQEAIDGWARVRPRVESEEAERRERAGPVAPRGR